MVLCPSPQLDSELAQGGEAETPKIPLGAPCPAQGLAQRGYEGKHMARKGRYILTSKRPPLSLHPTGVFQNLSD